MKKIFKYIAVLAASVTAFGCYPEVLEVDSSKLPQASDLKPVVSVNQETNEVTLSIENTDVTPVWIPGDVAINDQYNGDKVYKGTVTLVFNEKGEHVVELKAYNSYGLSQGSQRVEFKLDSEKPFDKGLLWWNNTEETNLWLTANTNDRSYYYAPGWSQIADPAVEDGRHSYTVTLPEATTDQWQAQMAFNNLGISTKAGKKYDFQVILNSTKDHPGVTVKLTKNSDDNVFYCADRHVLKAGSNYIYTLTELEGQDIDDLKLVFDFGGNEVGTVITIKEIVFSEHQDDHIPYVSDEGNLWMDAKMDVSFWFADESWNQVDNPGFESKGNYYKVTMPDGMGSQQWQGQLVFNNTGLNTVTSKGYTFVMKLKSTADHPGVTVKLTQQDDDNVYFFADRHILTANEEYVYETDVMAGVAITNAKMVLDFGGGAAGSSVEIYDIALREAELPGPDMTIFDPDYEGNMWRKANRDSVSIWFADNNWLQVPDFGMKTEVVKVDTVLVAGNDTTFLTDTRHSVVIPEGTGASQWQGQVKFNKLGLQLDPAKVYDFYLVLHSTEAHPGAYVKFAAQDTATGTEGATIADFGSVKLPECQDVVFKKSKVKKVTADDMMLILDFGGGTPGTKVIIKDVLIQEHRE